MYKAYYNEIDKYCVKRLKHLMDTGRIMKGDIDDRPIQEVRGKDLEGYTRCHFFAGIAGWELSLQFAGWMEGRQVWTGSCPCQPFSGAGKQKAEKDERHLWPYFWNLIAECRPATVFGEQVTGPLGRAWVQAVQLDLEELGYSCGRADLSAACVGAPHKRQRHWWGGWLENYNEYSERWEKTGNNPEKYEKEKSTTENSTGSSKFVDTVSVGDSDKQGLEGWDKRIGDCSGEFSAWEGSTFVPCLDGKARPVKPGILPLAHGIPGRVDIIRAYGNAIVPQVGAIFVRAFMDYQSKK